MAKTMNPSEATPITAGQIGKIQDLLAAALRKSGLSSAFTQGVIEDPIRSSKLTDAYVEVTRQQVEVYRRDAQPHLLQRKPFDPQKFLGRNWRIDERIGTRSGDYLDAGKIVLKDYLQADESSIIGRNLFDRIKADPTDIQLDADDYLALYEEPGQLTLRWLYATKGMTWLSFWGVILRNSYGRRRVLCLYRRDSGSWGWRCGWVDGGRWDVGSPATVLAS